MFLRGQQKDPTTMMRVGLFFLILGALSLRFLSSRHWLPEDLSDGITGLFYGLAIGCILVSLRLRNRQVRV